jgi:hypothetical protein
VHYPQTVEATAGGLTATFTLDWYNRRWTSTVEHEIADFPFIILQTSPASVTSFTATARSMRKRFCQSRSRARRETLTSAQRGSGFTMTDRPGVMRLS